jgi:methionine sulfoxide reductase heme-binding subunit
MKVLWSTSWRRLWIFLLSLIPFIWLGWRLFTDDLGPEPAKTLVITCGVWAANFLVLTLAVTPSKRFLKLRVLSTHRRMLGLFCWFYASLHFGCYVLFILGADFQSITHELTQRPFIIASIPAWILLSILAITSPRFVMVLCGKRWKYIHQSIYVVALLTVLHIAWQVRASYKDAIVYGCLLIGLLALRLIPSNRQKNKNV